MAPRKQAIMLSCQRSQSRSKKSYSIFKDIAAAQQLELSIAIFSPVMKQSKLNDAGRRFPPASVARRNRLTSSSVLNSAPESCRFVFWKIISTRLFRILSFQSITSAAPRIAYEMRPTSRILNSQSMPRRSTLQPGRSCHLRAVWLETSRWRTISIHSCKKQKKAVPRLAMRLFHSVGLSISRSSSSLACDFYSSRMYLQKLFSQSNTSLYPNSVKSLGFWVSSYSVPRHSETRGSSARSTACKNCARNLGTRKQQYTRKTSMNFFSSENRSFFCSLLSTSASISYTNFWNRMLTRFCSGDGYPSIRIWCRLSSPRRISSTRRLWHSRFTRACESICSNLCTPNPSSSSTSWAAISCLLSSQRQVTELYLQLLESRRLRVSKLAWTSARQANLEGALRMPVSSAQSLPRALVISATSGVSLLWEGLVKIGEELSTPCSDRTPRVGCLQNREFFVWMLKLTLPYLRPWLNRGSCTPSRVLCSQYSSSVSAGALNSLEQLMCASHRSSSPQFSSCWPDTTRCRMTQSRSLLPASNLKRGPLSRNLISTPSLECTASLKAMSLEDWLWQAFLSEKTRKWQEQLSSAVCFSILTTTSVANTSTASSWLILQSKLSLHFYFDPRLSWQSRWKGPCRMLKSFSQSRVSPAPFSFFALTKRRLSRNLFSGNFKAKEKESVQRQVKSFLHTVANWCYPHQKNSETPSLAR